MGHVWSCALLPESFIDIDDKTLILMIIIILIIIIIIEIIIKIK